MNTTESVERREPSYTIGENVNCDSQYREQYVCSFKKKIELPSDPAIPLLCMFPEKNMALNIMCTPMFTVPLFTIAKT